MGVRRKGVGTQRVGNPHCFFKRVKPAQNHEVPGGLSPDIIIHAGFTDFPNTAVKVSGAQAGQNRDASRKVLLNQRRGEVFETEGSSQVEEFEVTLGGGFKDFLRLTLCCSTSFSRMSTEGSVNQVGSKT